MLMMSTENSLWLAGVFGEVVVFVILVRRRAWRTFPFFFAFCLWEPLTDAANLLVLHSFQGIYPTVYLSETVLDSFLQFAVLVEIAWAVLRPIRGSLPQRTLPLIVLMVFILGAAVWPFSGLHMLSGLPPTFRWIVHVQQTTSILRILFFLLLAACSQLLSIGWRDRELQVVTGLGIYSIVSLLAAMMHTRETSVVQYGHLNQLVAASFVCSTAYWAFSFAQKEAPRREFTPQMQSFLLAVAGAARAERAALAESASPTRRQENL
jgi:hypothetical protein